MPTTLTLTPQPASASVLLAIAGAPSPTTVYSQGFEGTAGAGTTDSWTLAGATGTVSTTTTGVRTGVRALSALNDGPVGLGIPSWQEAGDQIQRSITGLTIGTRYRVSIWAKGSAASPGARFAAGVDGIGDGTKTNLDGVWRLFEYEWVATATSHVIHLRMMDLTGATYPTTIYLDDVTVSTIPATDLTITRSDANGAGPVRLLEGQEPSAGTLAVVDYEPALVGTITYTVVDGAGTVTTASTTLEGTIAQPWLGVPVLPELGLQVPVILDDYTATRDSRGTLHVVVGRPDPVPTLAPLSTRSGTLSVLVPDHATAETVATVYNRGAVVHLRQPTHAALDMYHVGTRVSVSPDGPRWRVGIDFTEVGRPIGPLTGGLAGWDFTQLAASYPDFATVRDTYPDFAAVTANTP